MEEQELQQLQRKPLVETTSTSGDVVDLNKEIGGQYDDLGGAIDKSTNEYTPSIMKLGDEYGKSNLDFDNPVNAYTASSPQEMEYMRGDRQSGAGNVARFAGRLITVGIPKTLLKVGEGLAVAGGALYGLGKTAFEHPDVTTALIGGIGGLAASGVNKIMDELGFEVKEDVGKTLSSTKDSRVSNFSYIYNNPVLNSLSTADQEIGKAVIPVYKKRVDDQGLWNYVTAASTWNNDIIDGLAFSGAAFVSASGFSMLGKAIGLTGKALEHFAEIGTTIYNTNAESGQEVKGYSDELKQTLPIKMFNTTYDELNGEQRKAVDVKIDDACIRGYIANAAFLIAPEFLMSKVMVGAKGFNAHTMLNMIKRGEKVPTNVIKETLKEGFIIGMSEMNEEYTQFAIQNAAQKMATGEMTDKYFGDFMVNIVDNYVQNLPAIGNASDDSKLEYWKQGAVGFLSSLPMTLSMHPSRVRNDIKAYNAVKAEYTQRIANSQKDIEQIDNIITQLQKIKDPSKTAEFDNLSNQLFSLQTKAHIVDGDLETLRDKYKSYLDMSQDDATKLGLVKYNGDENWRKKTQRMYDQLDGMQNDYDKIMKHYSEDNELMQYRVPEDIYQTKVLSTLLADDLQDKQIAIDTYIEDLNSTYSKMDESTKSPTIQATEYHNKNIVPLYQERDVLNSMISRDDIAPEVKKHFIERMNIIVDQINDNIKYYDETYKGIKQNVNDKVDIDLNELYVDKILREEALLNVEKDYKHMTSEKGLKELLSDRKKRVAEMTKEIEDEDNKKKEKDKRTMYEKSLDIYDTAKQFVKDKLGVKKEEKVEEPTIEEPVVKEKPVEPPAKKPTTREEKDKDYVEGKKKGTFGLTNPTESTSKQEGTKGTFKLEPPPVNTDNNLTQLFTPEQLEEAKFLAKQIQDKLPTVQQSGTVEGSIDTLLVKFFGYLDILDKGIKFTDPNNVLHVMSDRFEALQKLGLGVNDKTLHYIVKHKSIRENVDKGDMTAVNSAAYTAVQDGKIVSTVHINPNTEVEKVDTEVKDASIDRTVQDAINDNLKVVAGGNAIGKTLREYTKEFTKDTNGDTKVNYGDINNKVETSNPTDTKFVQVNDKVTLEVVDKDDIEITLPDNTLSTWGAFKKELSPEERYKYVPIRITHNNTGKEIGWVHDETWLKKSKMNLAEGSDEKTEIDKNATLRNAIILKGGKATSSILDKSNGVLLIAAKVEGVVPYSTISDSIPNAAKAFEDRGYKNYRNNQFVVNDGTGRLLTSQNDSFTMNIEDKHRETMSNSKFSGYVFTPVPTSNGKVILTALQVPKISEKLATDLAALIYQFGMTENAKKNTDIFTQLKELTTVSGKAGGIDFNSVDGLRQYLDMFVYLQGFNKEDATDGVVRIAVNKEGKNSKASVQFTLGDGVIFYINKDGSINITGTDVYNKLLDEIREGIQGSRRKLTHDPKIGVYSMLIRALQRKFHNVDIKNINKRSNANGIVRHMVETYKGEDGVTKFRQINTNKTYNDYLAGVLKTNLVEGVYKEEGQEDKHFYTVNSVMHIDTNLGESATQIVGNQNGERVEEPVKPDIVENTGEVTQTKPKFKVGRSSDNDVTDKVKQFSGTIQSPLSLEEERDKYIAKGLTFEQQQEAVEWITSGIKNDILNSNEFNRKSVQQQLEGFKNDMLTAIRKRQEAIEDFGDDLNAAIGAELEDANGNSTTFEDLYGVSDKTADELQRKITEYNKLINSWDKIIRGVDMYLEGIGIHKEKINDDEVNDEEFDQLEYDYTNEGTEGMNVGQQENWGREFYTVDGYNKDSIKLKMFLSSIKDMKYADDKRDSNGKTINKRDLIANTNYLGFARTLDGRTVYEGLKRMLQGHGSYMDGLERMLTDLNNSEVAWHNQLYRDLMKPENIDMLNIFFKGMSSQYIDMMFTGLETLNFGDRVVTKMIPMSSDRNSIIRQIIGDWQENQKTAYTRNKEDVMENTPVSKTTLIKKDKEGVIRVNRAVAIEWKKWFDDGNITADRLHALLYSLGVDLTLDSVRSFYNFPANYFPKDKGVTITTESLFKENSKYGAIYNLIHALVPTGKEGLQKGESYTEDSELNHNNPLYKEQLLLKTLAKLKLKEQQGLAKSTQSYKLSNGNTANALSKNNYLSHRLNILTSNYNKILDELATLPLTHTEEGHRSNSWTLSAMMKGERNWTDNFEMKYADGMTQLRMNTDGKTLSELSENELETYLMANFFNEGRGANNKATTLSRFVPLIYSDKTMATNMQVPREILSSPHIDAIQDKGVFKVNDVKLAPADIDRLYNNTIQCEIDRINHFIETRKTYDEQNGKGAYKRMVGDKYCEGADKFLFIPYMNEFMKEFRTTEGKYENITPDGLERIKDKLQEILLHKVQKKVQFWIDELNVLDTLERNGKSVEYLKLSTSYLYNVIGDSYKTNAEKIAYAALDMTYWYMIIDADYMKLFAGDPAQFWKKGIDSTWVEINKRLAKDIAPGSDGRYIYNIKGIPYNFYYYKQIYVDDASKTQHSSRYAEMYKKWAGVDYTGVQGADAQEWITLKERIACMYSDDMISTDMFKGIMDRIKASETKYVNALNNWKEGMKKPVKDNVYLTDEEKKVLVFQSQKPVYVGSKLNVHLGIDKQTYIKTSATTLLAEIVEDSELDKLRRRMEEIEAVEDTTCRAATVTGTKLGALNPIKMWRVNENGAIDKFDEEALATVQTEQLDRSGFRIQQDEPLHTHNRINMVSQANKLVASGLIDEHGSLIDGFKLGGKTLNGREIVDMKENVMSQLFKNAKKKLLKNLGVEVDEQGNARIDKLDKVQKILLDETIRRNFSIEDQNSLDLTADGTSFITPLIFNNNFSKFDSLINSIVTNSIVKHKFPGSSYVQTSSIGMIGKGAGRDIVWCGERMDIIKGLKYTEPKEDGGIAYAQVLAPMKYLDKEGKPIDLDSITKIDENGRKVLNVDKMDEELLKIVGMRIPNQGFSSMIALEIVGFLPAFMGDTMYVPEELTKQMGSDFDIDHLYTYSANTETKNIYGEITDDKLKKVLSNFNNWMSVQEDNELSVDEMKLQYAANNKMDYSKGKWYNETGEYRLNKVQYDLEKDVNTMSDKQLENIYIDLFKSVLEHPEIAKKTIQPLDIDNLNVEAERQIKLAKKNNNDYDTYIGQEWARMMRMVNKAGKRGTADESLASTMLILMQDKGIHLVTIKGEDDYIELCGLRLGRIGLGNNAETGLSNHNYIMLLQSKAVDNTKEQLLFHLGYNEITAKVFNGLLFLTTDTTRKYREAACLSGEYLVNFVKQEGIQMYVKAMANLYTMLDTSFDTGKKENITLELRGDLERNCIKQGGNDKMIKEKLKETTEGWLAEANDEDLFKLQGTKEEDKNLDYHIKQLALFDMYLRVEAMGEQLQKVQSALNFDTKGTGKSLFDSIVREEKIKEAIYNSSTFSGLENMLSNGGRDTELGTLYKEAIQFNNELWGKLLPLNSVRLGSVFDMIEENTGKDYLTAELRMELLKEHKSYLMNNTEISNRLFEGRDLEEERRRLLFDNEFKKSLGKRIQEYKGDKGIRRFFTSMLNTEFPDVVDGKHETLVKYPAYKTERGDEYRNILDWIDMLTSKDPEEKKLGEDMLRYAILEGGIQNTQSYIKYLSNRVMQVYGMTQYYNNIDWSDNTNTRNFIDQYYRHYAGKAPKLADIDNIARDGSIKTYQTTNVDKGTEITKTVVTEFIIDKPKASTLTTLQSTIKLERIGEDGKVEMFYPRWLSIYNTDLRRFVLYIGGYETSIDGYRYVAQNPLGTGKLGMKEYDSNKINPYSVFENNKIVPEVIRKIEVPTKTAFEQTSQEEAVPNQLAYSTLWDKYFDKNKKIYNKEDVLEAMRRIDKAGGKYSDIAKVVLTWNSFIDNTLTVHKNEGTARGLLEGDKISINPELFDVRRGMFGEFSNENEEFENTLLHEVIHNALNKMTDMDRRHVLEGLPKFFMDKLRDIHGQFESYVDNKLLSLLSGEMKDETERIRWQSVKDDMEKRVNAKQAGTEKASMAEYSNAFSRAINHVMTKSNGNNAFGEFIDMALNDKILMKELNSIKDKNGRSLWDKIVDKIKQLVKAIGRKIGIEINDDSLLASTISSVTGMMEEIQGNKSIKQENKEIQFIPYKWSRYSDNNYEVSSKGDKRFSALYAKLQKGTLIPVNTKEGIEWKPTEREMTIEEVYQTAIKGYNSIQEGKGKKPLYDLDYEEQYELYKELWKEYLEQNPIYKKDLRERSYGKTLTDMFATGKVSQARALTELLNEEPYIPKSKSVEQLNLFEEKQNVDIAKLSVIQTNYKHGGNTVQGTKVLTIGQRSNIDNELQGVRTETTRSMNTHNKPKIGDYEIHEGQGRRILVQVETNPYSPNKEDFNKYEGYTNEAWDRHSGHFTNNWFSYRFKVIGEVDKNNNIRTSDNIQQIGFKLSIDKKGKDHYKADIANAFIGYGVEGTSTKQYSKDAEKQDIPINEQIQPNENTIAFVSINGAGKLNTENKDKTIEQIKRVLNNGGRVLMDNDTNANSSWNKNGEGLIQEILKKEYNVELSDNGQYNIYSKIGEIDKNNNIKTLDSTQDFVNKLSPTERLLWNNSTEQERRYMMETSDNIQYSPSINIENKIQNYQIEQNEGMNDYKELINKLNTITNDEVEERKKLCL